VQDGTTRRGILVVLLMVGLVAGSLVGWRLVAASHEGPTASPSGTGTPTGGPQLPNILVIVTDDQRDGLDVMPKTRQWFAAGGTSYPWGFDTTPICCPSRTSIMTGRYTHNHHVRGNGKGQALHLDQETTVQRYLQQAGYRTGIYGKYLNKWPLDVNPPHFDRWAVFTRTPNVSDKAYVGGPWNVNGKVRTVTTYSTTFIRSRALGFVKGGSSQPWYLYLAPPAPHRPFVPEPAFANAPISTWKGNPAVFEADRSDKAPYVRAAHTTFARGQEIRTAQLRTLMSVDVLVDEVMKSLQATGQLDNTLAFFISDNGYFWGEHGLEGKPPPYLQATRVPFMARWPGHLDAAAVDERLVANIDITPTMFQAAGISPDPGKPVDGRSLLDHAWTRDRLLLENFTASSSPRWASTVTHTFQYIEYYARDDRTITFREYYALTKDPWQLVNLLHDGDPTNNPDKAMLHATLSGDRTCAGEACP
jgi:arylsulfatase A-like enzyme